MNKTLAPLGILTALGCVLMSFGCSRSSRSTQDVAHQAQPAPRVLRNGGSALPPPPEIGKPPRKGVIYVPSATGGDDNNLIAQPVAWRPSQSPALDSLNALIQAHDSPLPPGTELRGVKIADGLATVDFSREFQTNFHGGDTEEAQTVNSILRTLGQFPNIERVQILVEGKPIDALSQLLISSPLDVIRPETVRQARNGGN